MIFIDLDDGVSDMPKTRVLIESDEPFTKIDGKKYTFNNLIKNVS